jgi:hypothetical protein
MNMFHGFAGIRGPSAGDDRRLAAFFFSFRRLGDDVFRVGVPAIQQSHGIRESDGGHEMKNIRSRVGRRGAQ